MKTQKIITIAWIICLIYAFLAATALKVLLKVEILVFIHMSAKIVITIKYFLKFNSLFEGKCTIKGGNRLTSFDGYKLQLNQQRSNIILIQNGISIEYYTGYWIYMVIKNFESSLVIYSDSDISQVQKLVIYGFVTN